MRNSTSINSFIAGLDLFKLSKPVTPDGFWKLSEEMFSRISGKSEHVNYLQANRDVSTRQNILLIVFALLCFQYFFAGGGEGGFSVLDNILFIFITC